MVDDTVFAEALDGVGLDAGAGKRVDLGVHTVHLRGREWGVRKYA